VSGFAVFSTGELDLLEAAFDGSLVDLAQVYTPSTATDSYGIPVGTYSAGNTFSCEFAPGPGKEVQGVTEVEQPDARLRVDLDSESYVIDKDNRIKVIQRFGVALTGTFSDTYEIMGPPGQSAAGLVVELRKATL
jgi:hypothetical protein